MTRRPSSRRERFVFLATLFLAATGARRTAAQSEEAAAQPLAVEPSASASGPALLSLAEEAMTTLDYDRSRALARRAIAQGALDVDGLIRAYRLIAVASAQLDDAESAEQACLRLFALEPESNIATRLAPARRSAVLDARGFWATRKNAFGIEVSYARRERQVVVKMRDPIDWARTVHVWSRFGEARYVKAEQPVATELLFDIADVDPTDALEVYVFATDEHGNTLLQFGRERDPHLFGLSDEELAEFMRRDIRGGQMGSYGLRLAELGVEVGLHGYVSLEFKEVNDEPSFDLHHATAMIRASLWDKAAVELALEWEHLGPDTGGEFYIPHAFIDLEFTEFLIVRGGFFEVPVGAFNEYLYPDFLRITGLAPLFSLNIVPALWSEVGLQLRGRFPLGTGAQFTYAAFVSNGLEQEDDAPNDGVIQEGGAIDDMRFNARDMWSADKAVGGRLGVEIGDFDVGVSGYTGRYTIEGSRRLSIADVDMSYRGRWLTVRTEGAYAFQEVTDDVLRKRGLYVLVAGRPIGYLEPYSQYDIVAYDLGDADTTLQRVLVGLAVYPFPDVRATSNLRLKSEAGFEFPEGESSVFVWFFQLTTGF